MENLSENIVDYLEDYYINCNSNGNNLSYGDLDNYIDNIYVYDLFITKEDIKKYIINSMKNMNELNK